jgi:hypothetical protein
MSTIDCALTDPNLLGAALGDPTPWHTWRIVLRAAFGLPISDEERATFATIAGDRASPLARVRELWAIIGRRSGKSRMAAACGVYLACFSPRKLAAGEVGEVAIIAASRDQARVVFKYVEGFLQASPILRQEIESVTASEVRLRGDIIISIRSGSFRTVRGRTLLACVLDEVAFLRDETSATPDVETYRAVLPALATTNGMLIGISTPYRRFGLLFQKHRDHYGQNDPDVLVIAGNSRQFNPTLDSTVIARAVAADPEAARAEWEGEFRADISAFLDDELIEAAIDLARPLELAPRLEIQYRAFVDASGGRGDHYTLAIGHKEGEHFIADVIRGKGPPFDPQATTQEFAALVKEYRVREVTGDNYAAAWVANAWRNAGLRYVRSELHKSALYLEALPLFTRGAVAIPDHKRLARELRLLERRTSRVGKDIVDHGRGGSDDYANALVGMLDLLTNRKTLGAQGWGWGNWSGTIYRTPAERAEIEAERNVANGSRPCLIDFKKLEKPLPEGLSRRYGPPRIW